MRSQRHGICRLFEFFLKVALSHLLGLSLLESTLSLGEDHRISDASGLIAFANSVNSGSNFSGITVYLDADIAFDVDTPSNFTPIGSSAGHHFSGTFNGQGHIIKSLVVDSNANDSGLFSFSYGMTVQNLVLDKSCSFTNNLDFNESIIGHGTVLGSCHSIDRECIIEGVVNMAPVTFVGKHQKS